MNTSIIIPGMIGEPESSLSIRGAVAPWNNSKGDSAKKLDGLNDDAAFKRVMEKERNRNRPGESETSEHPVPEKNKKASETSNEPIDGHTKTTEAPKETKIIFAPEEGKTDFKMDNIGENVEPDTKKPDVFQGLQQGEMGAGAKTREVEKNAVGKKIFPGFHQNGADKKAALDAGGKFIDDLGKVLGNDIDASRQDPLGSAREILPTMISKGSEAIASNGGIANRTPGVGSEIMSQIIEKAVFRQKQDQAEIRMELKPPELGHLKMSLVTEDHRVSLKIVTETAMVKGVIEQNIHHLKTSLHNQGLPIDQFNVGVGKNFDNREKDAHLSFPEGVAEPDEIQMVSGDMDISVHLNSGYSYIGRIDYFV